ncbi:acyl-CoA dehydrogenase family protein [Haliangium ochraceum]|uniref:Acyl-CoA dehydrogenase domain protein n=1 Tax=Haliangium ochraceum (strain DSM 14365 / JCM 11303 / SMP-2) TaxID=502025 RepID=D0LVI9_HALO1|nr:acyl-CoA dehydrogenase family protein [Haliangium ochraceum]ACY17550.1 acyl-CoA dehydrogenase domain protein [Haliangium ochraceum DSM 14365]
MPVPHSFEDSLCNPSEEHAMLRQTVREFTRKEVEPQAEQHDRSATLNVGLLRELGKLGLLGITIPEEAGGAGMDAVASVLVHEELSYSDPGFALAYLAHSLLFVNNLYFAANDEQRARYLPRTLTAEHVGAMGMTEPAVGTDVLGMRTSARRTDDGYVLSGHKTFITNAPEAEVFVVYAQLDKRLTTFVVERGMSGFSVSDKIPKMGMRASTMAELVFEDVRVPAANLLGKEGGGITNMMRNLEIERLGLAAMSLGIANRCLDVMVRYSSEREAFGKPISDFGQIQRYIGESYAKVEAIRGLLYGVARTVSHGSRNRLGTDAVKLFAATAAKEVADAAVQVLGGYGYCAEYRVEQFLRDAKLIEIGGGTIEAHQKNITRDLIKQLRG